LLSATTCATTAPTHVRHRVLGLLCIMSFILYLDRICISQAAKRIEEDLDISHTAMGFVFGSFTLAYGLFQVPTGHWGDRFGSRRVLAGMVWRWSLLTMITGLSNGLLLLLIVRFLFGAGEAGALPNAVKETEDRFLDLGRAAQTDANDHPSIPWRRVLTAANVWLIGAISTCCAFTTYLFFFWYSTYLQEGRSLSPELASQMAGVVLIS